MWVVVDVEADGPCPSLYSMVSFGAVAVEPSLTRTFLGRTAPISHDFNPEALAISKITREQHLAYPNPQTTMREFEAWLRSLKRERLTFVSDNPAFDWQFINYYCHRYLGRNPFGYSARRIGDLWSGFQRDASKASEWKKFRKTKHTHCPVDDAMGNAEAILTMIAMGIRIDDVQRPEG
jgi:DNA polymerase III epsilon subunit-like protein